MEKFRSQRRGGRLRRLDARRRGACEVNYGCGRGPVPGWTPCMADACFKFTSSIKAVWNLRTASSDARLAASEKSDLNSVNAAFPVPVTTVSAIRVPPASVNVQLICTSKKVGGHVSRLSDDDCVVIRGSATSDAPLALRPSTSAGDLT